MIQIKICEHYKNKFGNAPSGTEIIFTTEVIVPSPFLIEYLKHLKESLSCYYYSGLTQSVDELLNQIKNNLQEMLKMLE